MATHGDYDGVWFTIQAIRMYHSEALEDLSFVVIDNDPEGVTATPLREIGNWVPGYRYVPFSGYAGTAVRDLVFREADADVVCCVDSHVLLAPGALEALRDWFDTHPDSLDLLQGPMLHDNLDLERAVTHLEPTWGAGMYGQWGRDPRLDVPGCAPFEITMHGLGVFACRKSAWPGLNPRLRGFGAEEGYLHELFRRRGGRVLCHPRLSWAHRFSRPMGISYPNRWEDRIRNYLVAWGELGWDVAPMESHYLELLGAEFDVATLIESVRAQVQDPLGVFDAVFCLRRGAGGCDQHAHPPGIAWRVERVQVDATLQGERRRLSAWHDALVTASGRGYRHVLLLDDESDPETLPGLDPAQLERPWDLCLLASTSTDGVQPPPSFPTAGSVALAGLAVAVHARAYGRILADLGSDDAGRQAFLARWPDLDTYLLQGMSEASFTAIGEPFAEPASDRPVLAPGVQLVELAGGLMVHQQTPPRVHELNNTASMVVLLCDGERTVAAVAAELAESFALATAPLAEVCACVDGLRRTGVLVVHRDASARSPGSVTEYGRS
ncbi:MAG TPA: PqqD family peptide modification chaperone [Solirubrobacteraceae bacterium]|nr:PqqD family peptide modification chaperone [Solirubrobacteraceae bacterium]